MAPISRIFVAALCALAASPVLSAPVQSSTALGRRQLHGEGVAADAILTDTDNGVGYGIENAENNAAALITSVKGGSTSPLPAQRRQLDKIANGAANVASAAGAPQVGGVVQTYGDSVDGELTDGVANAGTQIGATEESTLENAGNSVPTQL